MHLFSNCWWLPLKEGSCHGGCITTLSRGRWRSLSAWSCSQRRIRDGDLFASSAKSPMQRSLIWDNLQSRIAFARIFYSRGNVAFKLKTMHADSVVWGGHRRKKARNLIPLSGLVLVLCFGEASNCKSAENKSVNGKNQKRSPVPLWATLRVL